jgi:hypothetical protein
MIVFLNVEAGVNRVAGARSFKFVDGRVKGGLGTFSASVSTNSARFIAMSLVIAHRYRMVMEGDYS